jgi:hypothetical protein
MLQHAPVSRIYYVLDIGILLAYFGLVITNLPNLSVSFPLSPGIRVSMRGYIFCRGAGRGRRVRPNRSNLVYRATDSNPTRCFCSYGTTDAARGPAESQTHWPPLEN